MVASVSTCSIINDCAKENLGDLVKVGRDVARVAEHFDVEGAEPFVKGFKTTFGGLYPASLPGKVADVKLKWNKLNWTYRSVEDLAKSVLGLVGTFFKSLIWTNDIGATAFEVKPFRLISTGSDLVNLTLGVAKEGPEAYQLLNKERSKIEGLTLTKKIADIAKKSTCIALCVLSLAGLLFGAAISSTIFLGLSITVVTSSLVSFFLKKNITAMQDQEKNDNIEKLTEQLRSLGQTPAVG